VRPKLLDLFCGAGGASVGYERAGFEVIGIDNRPQSDYPFEFYCEDAMWLLRRFRSRGPEWFGNRFDAIHASPPCQASSALTKGTNKGREYVNLIPETRSLLRATGLPTIIENVQGSDLRRDLTLCGEMFGLDVIRHRYFELEGFDATQPTHVPHRGRVRGWRHGTYYDGPYVAVYGDGGGKGSVVEWQAAMGIDWTEDRKAIAEAIPPAYSEFIGRRLLAQIEVAA
jgi:DNA (cytosine-5)-methyltransferase 1